MDFNVNMYVYFCIFHIFTYITFQKLETYSRIRKMSLWDNKREAQRGSREESHSNIRKLWGGDEYIHCHACNDDSKVLCIKA
jgi:hypothetical protein